MPDYVDHQPFTLPEIPEYTAQGPRVTAMAALFGLSEGDVKRDPAHWQELLESCASCGDQKACQRVLAKGNLANPRNAGFCVNRDAFRAHWAHGAQDIPPQP